MKPFCDKNLQVWTVRISATQQAWDDKGSEGDAEVSIVMHRSPAGGWYLEIDGTMAIDGPKEFGAIHDALARIAAELGWGGE